MSVTIRMEPIIPAKAIFNPAEVSRVIERTLDRQAKLVQTDFNKTTSTWQHGVPFYIAASIGERVIATSDDIYRYVSEGTKVRRVIMTPNFSPKSKRRFIGASVGAGGVAFGPSKRINRPGIKAREFAEAIADKWQDALKEYMQDAINAAFK